MKICIICFMLINLISCSPPSSFNDNNDLQEKNITEDNTLNKKEEVLEKDHAKNHNISTKKESCYEGCNFYNRTFKVVKEVKKNSLSLNNAQIKSLHIQCKNYCSNIFKNDIVLKQQVQKEELPINKENKEEKKTNGSLTPFEDL